MYYLNYFFIFSIFGHLLETTMYKIFNWNLESGFLYGYWTPVYGLGVILILFLSNCIFKKLKLNKFLEIIIFLIIIVLILTFIEYAGGILLEITFDRVFWDYSDHKYHFGKYVALDISLIWGICSIILIYLVKPWMDKIVNKIPQWVTYLLCILFIIDIICTYAFKSKI